jgi:hypothetical protein
MNRLAKVGCGVLVVGSAVWLGMDLWASARLRAYSEITKGMSLADVEQRLGAPARISEPGASGGCPLPTRRIYYYNYPVGFIGSSRLEFLVCLGPSDKVEGTLSSLNYSARRADDTKKTANKTVLPESAPVRRARVASAPDVVKRGEACSIEPPEAGPSTHGEGVVKAREG